MTASNADRLAQRKDAEARLPPFWQHGFRPFFFLGAVWAALAIGIWTLALSGAVELPTALDPVAWHRHELLFGWLVAIVAAFLLTAIPNWTGRLPVRGLPLVGLVALWLAARVGVLAGAVWGPWPGLVLDVGFVATLASVAAREVIAGNNRRNLPVVGLLGLLALASLLSHLEAMDVPLPELAGDRLALGVVTMLVALIGGRIVPSFTTNWLRQQGATVLPASIGAVDKVALAITGLALVAWLAAPQSAVAGVLLLAAAVASLVRLARWRGTATLAEPLVAVLHLGMLWHAAGLLALGLASLELMPRTAALHVVTAGTFGTMTLAVMTRASLGHTARALSADRWTVAIFALVVAGAATRVVAELWTAAYMPLLHIAATAWGGAFLLFALAYARVLFGPRVKSG